MENREFDYYAFVSYSRADEKWAKWIQRKLETYRFPTAFRRENQTLPARIFPIFRDKTDLTGGVLIDQLKHQLEESEYLIVICSPNSAGAPWVDWEITYFTSLGRGNNIIPLIVDGEPHAEDSARECYPPTLRNCEEELQGVNVAELGQDKSVLQVIAQMMRVRYERLNALENRRIFKRKILTACMISALLVALAGVVWYEIPHNYYYWSCVYKNELPEGLMKISREDRKKAHDYYKIVKRRNQIIRLERVNSAGKVTNALFSFSIDDYPVSEFSYDMDGKLEYVTKKDLYGDVLVVKKYNEDLSSVEYKNSADDSVIGRRSGSLISEQGNVSFVGGTSDSSNITGYLLDYENGYVTREVYVCDSHHTLACDENGIYGKLYSRDSQGKILRMTYLGWDGKPLRMQYGTTIAYMDYEYDIYGRITKITNYDADGNLAFDEDNICCAQYVYGDIDGNAQMLCLDADGNPRADIDGIAQYIFVCDERGYHRELYGYDEQRGLTYHKRSGACRIVFETDRNGHNTDIRYCDAEGKPITSNYGFAEVSYKYDRQGRCIEAWYYGPEGELVYNPQYNYSGYKTEYLNKGNTIRETFYNTDGEIALCSLGFAISITKLNEQGLVAEYAYYDAEGNPTRTRDCVSSIVYEYSNDGLLVSKSFFDEDGIPCINSSGVSVIKYKYKDSKVVSIQYFDTQGEPCYIADQNGNFSKWEAEYNSYGRVTRIRYYDINDKPVCNNGIYEETRGYDEKTGNCVTYMYYDYQGNRMDSMDGYASENLSYGEKGQAVNISRREKSPLVVTNTDYEWNIDMQYDDRGNMIQKISYFGVADENGIVPWRPIFREYDARDNMISEYLSEEDGQLIANEQGIALYTQEYDERDRKVSMAYYDVNKELINIGDEYAVIEFTYDEFNHLSGETYYNASGEGEEQSLTLFDSLVHIYDEYGNRTETWHYDSNGDVIADSNGIACTSTTYNVMGDCVYEVYYNSNGEATPCADGYAAMDTVYDDAGRAIQHHYYDEYGMPMTQDSGWPAREDMILDEYGFIKEKIIYNEKGELFMTEQEYPRIVYAYDRQGVNTAVWYYDCENQLAEAKVYVAYIDTVEPKSDAHLAGMRSSDIVLQYGDWNFFDDKEFHDTALSDLSYLVDVWNEEYTKVRIYREDTNTANFVLDVENDVIYRDAGIGTKNIKEYGFDNSSVGIQVEYKWMDWETVQHIREEYEELYNSDTTVEDATA